MVHALSRRDPLELGFDDGVAGLGRSTSQPEAATSAVGSPEMLDFDGQIQVSTKLDIDDAGSNYPIVAWVLFVSLINLLHKAIERDYIKLFVCRKRSTLTMSNYYYYIIIIFHDLC